MSEPIKIKIPAELDSAVVGGFVTSAGKINAGGGKSQQQKNDDLVQDTHVIDVKVNGIDNRLSVVEELGRIMVATDPEEYVGIATGSDFSDPDATQRAKVTTVGSILDGLNVDGAYDISVKNAVGGVPVTYADLTAALGTNGANVPQTVRKGGMIVKYVQSSDNTYVEYFLTKNSWSADVRDWEKLNLEDEVEQLAIDVNAKLGYEQIITSYTNGYTLNDNGELITNPYVAERGVSDFFKVTPGNNLYVQYGIFQGGNRYYSAIAFYSSNSESSFVSCVNNEPYSTEIINEAFPVPDTANYARVVLKDYLIPAVIGKQDKTLKELIDDTNDRIDDISSIIEGYTVIVEKTSALYATESGYGINATTGEKISRSLWYASDYIPISGGITVTYKAHEATTFGIAFYTGQTESSFISGVVNNGSEQSIIVPSSAKYYRFCDYYELNGYVKYSEQAEGLESKVEELEVEVNGIREELDALSEKFIYDNICFDSKIIIESGQKILGLGASFMRGNDTGTGTSNVWLYLLAQKVGTTAYNDANGGTNICYHANRIFNGTILGTGNAPISEIGAILIMHTHDKDVFTLPEPFASYTVAQYEANVLPFATTTGDSLDSVEYAKAFDYIIKKIQSIYFSYKSSQEYASGVQSYVGQYYFKPAQIIFCTHWNDARTKYNKSIRELCAKWGFPLVQFDKKVGFTRLQKNTAFNAQASLEFVGNIGGASPVETIGGIAYGWHPMCGGTDVYIQRKLATIAKDNFELW